MTPCCKECNSDIARKVNYFSRMSAQLATIAEELTFAAPARRPVGRPTMYSDTLANEICAAVELGGAIYKLCDELDHWPAEGTIYRWVEELPEFKERFTRARQRKAHRFVEEMATIADGDRPDVRRDELRIKTRQWVAGMLNREAYGQAPAVVNNTQQINVVGFAQSMRSKLEDMLDRKVIDVTPSDPGAT